MTIAGFGSRLSISNAGLLGYFPVRGPISGATTLADGSPGLYTIDLSSVYTVTLPKVSSLPGGLLIFKAVGGGTSSITLQRQGSDTIFTNTSVTSVVMGGLGQAGHVRVFFADADNARFLSVANLSTGV